MRSSAFVVALAISLAPVLAHAQVPLEKLYAGRNDEVRDITMGGNVGSGLAFAYGLSSVSALCIGPNRHLYAAELNPSQVTDITDGGLPVAPPYIDTYCSPRSLSCSETEIFVGCASGQIYDATAGGNLATQTPFATHVGDVVSLLRDSQGTLWAAANDGMGTWAIFDVTTGGDFTSATPFATTNQRIGGLVERGGTLLATLVYANTIVEFAGGGDLSSAPMFASGINGPSDIVDAQSFGLFVHSTDGNGTIYDVSAGGDFTNAPTFATGLALVGGIPLAYSGDDPGTGGGGAGGSSSGGQGGAGGVIEVGGNDLGPGGGGSTTTTSGGSSGGNDDEVTDGGCGCRAATSGDEARTWLWLAAAVVLGAVRRRRG